MRTNNKSRYASNGTNGPFHENMAFIAYAKRRYFYNYVYTTQLSSGGSTSNTCSELPSPSLSLSMRAANVLANLRWLD